jgi:hypothetical protein
VGKGYCGLMLCRNAFEILGQFVESDTQGQSYPSSNAERRYLVTTEVTGNLGLVYTHAPCQVSLLYIAKCRASHVTSITQIACVLSSKATFQAPCGWCDVRRQSHS